ncbi:f-box domain-containing protein [Ditylenchus destructor]|uniref:F-box domain-containing protein n=1 Tax=Ditylenchus destructor TaxID=166010 RepID=A0AAD4ME77_9BILA|nr:f-box domain-containing protein [Ditylenchus destructor]
MLSLLPIEVKIKILERLERKDLYNLRCVNHNLNDIILGQFDNKPPYVTYWVLEIWGNDAQNTYNLCEFEYQRKGYPTLFEERSRTLRILNNKFTRLKLVSFLSGVIDKLDETDNTTKEYCRAVQEFNTFLQHHQHLLFDETIFRIYSLFLHTPCVPELFTRAIRKGANLLLLGCSQIPNFDLERINFPGIHNFSELVITTNNSIDWSNVYTFLQRHHGQTIELRFSQDEPYYANGDFEIFSNKLIENVTMRTVKQNLIDAYFNGEERHIHCQKFALLPYSDMWCTPQKISQSLEWLVRNVRSDSISFPEWMFNRIHESVKIRAMLTNFIFDSSRKCKAQELVFSIVVNRYGSYRYPRRMLVDILIEDFLTLFDTVVQDTIPTVVINGGRFPVPEEFRANFGNNLIGREVDSQGADALYVIEEKEKRVRIAFRDRYRYNSPAEHKIYLKFYTN